MALKICFVMNNVGEYHAPRLNSCADAVARAGGTTCVVQVSSRSSFYAHKQRRASFLLKGLDFIPLPERPQGRQGLGLVRAIWQALSAVGPTHIFTIGYSDVLAWTCLVWARFHGVPVFFMADSKADDQPRRGWQQRIKSLVVRGFSGALVAGERHRQYFRTLGVKRPIEIGYDVIDNAFFRARAERLRPRVPWLRRRGLLPDRFVLCVSRLVERKRIDRVLVIFAASGLAAKGIRLLIIGAGPMESAMWDQARRLGIDDAICHHRNVRNTLMPLFYSQAMALVLASEYDQWGLCVNEAQAVGVPCIVSRRCGVAGEIVIDGDNGFVFDGDDIAVAAQALAALAQDERLSQVMSQRSLAIMEQWGPDRFGQAVIDLVTRS